MSDRVLGRLTSAFAACDFGTEDEECSRTAMWVLTARRSYSVPLYLCDTHADEEAFYYGTVKR